MQARSSTEVSGSFKNGVYSVKHYKYRCTGPSKGDKEVEKHREQTDGEVSLRTRGVGDFDRKH
jgi:hypothetical protein